MEFITLDDALKIAGHKNRRSFDKWARRFNEKNPSVAVLRRPGYVEKESLVRALQSYAKPK